LLFGGHCGSEDGFGGEEAVVWELAVGVGGDVGFHKFHVGFQVLVKAHLIRHDNLAVLHFLYEFLRIRQVFHQRSGLVDSRDDWTQLADGG
jgi:hypothetical protein